MVNAIFNVSSSFMVSTRLQNGFSRQQVANITGLTARQLNYWRRTEIIEPSSVTQGGHARYSFTDLIALKTVKQLLDHGVSLQKVRKSILALLRYLPMQQQPFSELKVIATGDVVLVFHQGIALDAVTGQEWILEVADLEKDIAQQYPETYQLVVEQDDLFSPNITIDKKAG